jgi:endonuclease/exonuclease/phosphatase family metal-dependent hydrolase
VIGRARRCWDRLAAVAGALRSGGAAPASMNRRRLGLAVALGALLAGGLSAAPAPTADREAWVIATYNVGNYTLADRRVGSTFRRAYPKPEAEKSALRSVIARLDADVLILQEIGGEDFLAELRRDLRSEGVQYPHGGVVAAADPDRRLAWLSRRPPREVRAHTDLRSVQAGRTEPVRRGLLELRWTDDAGELVVFGLHLKSRVAREDDDPGSAGLRLREAEAIRRRVLERVVDLENRRVLLVGDFNDARSSPVLARFREQGPRRLFHLVDAADSRGERWTHRFARDDAYSRVDYVLVSDAVQRRAGRVRAAVLDGPDVAQASDHRPVRLELLRD